MTTVERNAPHGAAARPASAPYLRVALVAMGIHKRGGTERALAELAEALVNEGHDLTIFAATRDPTILPGATWYRVPVVRWPSLARYLSFLIANSALRAWSNYRGQHFDIVHSTGPDVLRPTVTTLHCCTGAVAEVLQSRTGTRESRRWASLRRWHNMLSYRAIAFFERYVVRFGAQHVIVVSRALGVDVACHNGVSPARLTVIPNGVNLREFYPVTAEARLTIRKELSIPSKSLVFIFVGYNLDRKGLGILTDALARLKSMPQAGVSWLIVVGGRGEPSYEQSVMEALDGRARFLGPRADTSRLYQAADVCVLPSEQESFGLPVIEAMACALPTVVSRCAGVAELITDGVDGLLLDDPRDPAELARKLALLAASSDVRHRMGARARATAERYSWSEIARRVEALYYEVLYVNQERE